MKWQAITEPPKQTASVLVAVQVGDDDPFLLGTYLCRNGVFTSEQNGQPFTLAPADRAWWIDESVLFDVVPLPPREGAPAC